MIPRYQPQTFTMRTTAFHRLLMPFLLLSLAAAQCKVRVGVSFANPACADASMTSTLDIFGSYVYELECVPEDPVFQKDAARRLRGHKRTSSKNEGAATRRRTGVNRRLSRLDKGGMIDVTNVVDGPTLMVEMEEAPTAPTTSRLLADQPDATADSAPRNKQGYRVIGMTTPHERILSPAMYSSSSSSSSPDDNNSRALQDQQQNDHQLAVLDANGMECKMAFGKYVTDVGHLLNKYSTDENVKQCWQYVWCLVYK